MSLEYVTAAFVRNVTEQAKICINLKSEDLMEAEETVNENEADSLYAVYLQMMNHVSPGMPVVSTPSHLLTYIRRACLSFLQASATFFHFLTNVTPPGALMTDAVGGQFDVLCQYLGLPMSLSALFS